MLHDEKNNFCSDFRQPQNSKCLGMEHFSECPKSERSDFGRSLCILINGKRCIPKGCKHTHQKKLKIFAQFFYFRPPEDGINIGESILLLPRTGNNDVISGGNTQTGNGLTGNGDILNRIQTSSSSDSLNDDAILERFVIF